jgi:hypothetical protein
MFIRDAGRGREVVLAESYSGPVQR